MPKFYYKSTKIEHVLAFDAFFDNHWDILNKAQELADDIGADYPVFTGHMDHGYKLTHFRFNEEPDMAIWIYGVGDTANAYRLRARVAKGATVEQINQWKDIKSKLSAAKDLRYHYGDLSKELGLNHRENDTIFAHEDPPAIYCSGSAQVDNPDWTEVLSSEYVRASKEMKNC